MAARGQNVSLQIRLEKALENARAITNIQIQYDDVLWMKGRPISATESNHWKKTMVTDYPFDKDYNWITHNRYIASGKNYRAESKSESPQKPKNNNYTEMAFDGKLWSTFDTRNGSMSQQDGDNPGDLQNAFNPLILPFLFLSRNSMDCPMCNLRFTDLQSPEVLNGLVLPDPKNSNGLLHLSFPGLPVREGNQTWEITLEAADDGFKPITIARTVDGGGKYAAYKNIYTLSDYTNVGDYQFPTKMASSSCLLGTNTLDTSAFAMTTMVTVLSFKTPPQFSEATFRLDESKAARIWNMGQFKGFGVGLILGEAGSNIVVKRIDEDSPAGRQNQLHPDDRIVSIAESKARPVFVHAGKADLSRTHALLQGAKGSAVNITFVPSGKADSATQTVTLVRGEVRGRLSDGRLLTNGMKAPNIEMVTLTNRAIEHVSDYAGKIVVLEFWASWCPPCRKSMAELQLDFARYPDWKDKVVLIAASVDDTADIAAKQIESHGWSQTHNVWLKTKEIKSYHVGGIPAVYLINGDGIIAASGSADETGLNIPDLVNQQLGVAQKQSK